jgi:hypothetical protein
MKGFHLFLKLKACYRRGLSNVTRLACDGYAWLVRLTRKAPREIPPPLELCAAEVRQILSEAERRAEATVQRTAQNMGARFGASSQGVVKGVHETREEVLAWRHTWTPGFSNGRCSEKESRR